MLKKDSYFVASWNDAPLLGFRAVLQGFRVLETGFGVKGQGHNCLRGLGFPEIPLPLTRKNFT